MTGLPGRPSPTLAEEERLLATGAVTIIGMDEVGRGAIAGPVAVGAAAISALNPAPIGLADSKLLSPARRERLAPELALWAQTAVGLVSATMIDADGIIRALGVAGAAALRELAESGVDLNRSIVLLDGAHDWLSPVVGGSIHVVTRVKADRDCASPAAASVVAKVHRDALMVAAHEESPFYEWASNKGYGTAAHYAGIRAFGAHPLHRRTWLRPDAVAPVSAARGQ